MRVGLYYMIIFLLAATNLIAEELNIYAISKPNEAVKLIGPDANLQLVVTGENISDMTRSVNLDVYLLWLNLSCLWQRQQHDPIAIFCRDVRLIDACPQTQLSGKATHDALLTQ